MATKAQLLRQIKDLKEQLANCIGERAVAKEDVAEMSATIREQAQRIRELEGVT